MSKFGAIGLRPCQKIIKTIPKPSRGLASLRVKIWCNRAATLSKYCKNHTNIEQGFSNFACQNFVAIGLRPCYSAANTRRKSSRGFAMAGSPSFLQKRRVILLSYSLVPFHIIFFSSTKEAPFSDSLNLCCGPAPFSFQHIMAHHIFALFSGLFPCLHRKNQ